MTKKITWIIVILICIGIFFYVNKHADSGFATGYHPSDASAKTASQTVSSAATASDISHQSNTVTITKSRQQNADIAVAPVDMRPLPQTLSVAGQIGMDEKNTSRIGVIADGRITAVNVLPGDHVQRGSVLGELHSHMVHETAGALMKAYAAVDQAHAALSFARQEQNRYSHLYSIQAASLEQLQRSNQGLVQAKDHLVAAQASLQMEREHLSELLQVPPRRLTRNNLYNKELIPIRSPRGGVVVSNHVSVGQVVNAGYVTFVVTNLSTVWVTASVNEKDLSLLRIGEPATLTTQAYPGTVFHGRVQMIGDTLDPQTRTVPVRVAVPNSHTRLRPGMFATVQIAEPRTRNAIFVPQGSIQNVNGLTVVFTVSADGTRFHMQTVTTGLNTDGETEITTGLTNGDHIVVNGAFMVKSEMLKNMMDQD